VTIRYSAVIFDLDGTLTPVRSVWQYIHERLGVWDGKARRHQAEFEAGRISYGEFCARDAACWKGLPERSLREIADTIPYREGALDCVRVLQRAGCVVGVVSTGLSLLADRVRDEFGIAFTMANRLVSRGGMITGEVKVNLEHGRKEEAVDLFCDQFGVEAEQVITVGDSEGDICMFRRTGYSVAVQPSSESTGRAATVVHRENSLSGLVDRLPPFGRDPGNGSEARGGVS
jgi:phosphoserine phosphatase